MGTMLLRKGDKASGNGHWVELTFQCPVCLAMETLFVEDGMFIETRHWHQSKGQMYHRNCLKPARLINMTGSKLSLTSNTTVVLMRMLEQRRETVGQFAVNIGVSRITVKRWLLGKSYPNSTSRKRIARYTRMPLDVK